MNAAWKLRAALLITYFGDYCSLIGLYEFAKRFGSSNKVAGIYAAYCIPPLVMFLLSKQWARHQHRPTLQLGLVSGTGAIAVMSLLWATSYTYVLIVTFLLALTKESVQVLTNVYIKYQYSPEQAKKIVGDIVSSRFFVMVFGRSLGAYLGGLSRFDIVFGLDAATYIISGILFYHLTTTAAHANAVNSAPALQHRALSKMMATFQWIPWLWITSAAIAMGAFMGIEYPLITTQLGVPTKLIWAIWAGHAVGALCARPLVSVLLRAPQLSTRIMIFALLQVIAFGLVGMWHPTVVFVSAQIGIAAFMMVLLESLANYHLMHRSSKEDYPLYNLMYRIMYRLSIFIGALAPLALLARFSLIEANQIFNMNIIIGMVLIALLWRIVTARRLAHEPST